MIQSPEQLWRVFPWDPNAKDGEPYSSTYTPPIQGKGRFDLPNAPGGVLYLSETPEHAVAERIQQYRGHELDTSDLRVAEHSLALVSVTLPAHIRAGIIDLCDPEVLTKIRVRPDQLASRDRYVTQRIAADIHSAGHAGLRWWSSLLGDWHAVVVFRDRLDTQPAYGTPEPLTLDHTAVREAASALGIQIERP